MASAYDLQIEHLLRRAGFGARPDELDTYRALSLNAALDRLLEYQRIPDDVDTKIGQAAYVLNTPTSGAFAPNTVITDARQRWLFRMVHSDRPLQEKMTLFWHNHFATGYTKIAGQIGNNVNATRYMAARASEDPGRVRGQLEMLRDNALGNFQDILVAIAQDTAMLYWLDGNTNTKAKPQENFGREIMELFTMGVGNYTEPDVYAAARVFTGWNLSNVVSGAESHAQFTYLAANHETSEKTFSFAVYPDGRKTIPARSAAAGMQDGLDLIAGLVAHPNTAKYLARKLYKFFVSESGDVDEHFVTRIANTFSRTRGDMKAVIGDVLRSAEFWDSRTRFTRYSWPVEFVVRSLKEVGWKGFSVGGATLTALGNIGQNLYDPPDVAGWDLGKSWFSTGAMLARMNFTATLTANQRNRLFADVWDAEKGQARSIAKTPEALVSYVLDRTPVTAMSSENRAELVSYLVSTGIWTASETQIKTKLPGLVHLVTAAPEYQLV
jgi:uncharacterized protein (DUF1800 family)